MRIFPAVDIKDGRCVRLFQGRADEVTVYAEDPRAQARAWAAAGATRLHLVDLDGAFEGRPRNLDITLDIVKALAIEVEVGGGIRSLENARTLVDAGAARVILGTRAIEEPDFLRELARAFPGRVSLGLDAADGWLLTRGWVQKTGTRATALLQELRGEPLGEVIYTDVARDGALSGPNFEAIREVADSSPFPLVASGGVSSLADLERLSGMGLYAAVVGKALYTGDVDLAAALEIERQ